MANDNIRPIRLEGNVAFVPLTQGYEAIVDAEDVHLVEGVSWRAQARARAHTVYAIASKRKNGTRQTLIIHRVIMSAADGVIVDHINGDGLDNRKVNLRFATVAENLQNKRKPKNNTSGYKGVAWRKDRKVWTARICKNRKIYHLGSYSSKEAAYAAYVEAAQRIHGVFWRAS